MTILATGITSPSTWIVSTVPGLGATTDVMVAVNSAAAAGGGTVYVQPGTYSFNGNFPAGVSVVGATPSQSGDVIFQGNYTVTTGNVSFENITFLGQLGGATMNLSTSDEVTFDNCFISNISFVGSGILVSGGVTLVFQNSGIDTPLDALSGNTATITLLNSTIAASGAGAALDLSANATITATSCQFSAAGTTFIVEIASVSYTGMNNKYVAGGSSPCISFVANGTVVSIGETFQSNAASGHFVTSSTPTTGRFFYCLAVLTGSATSISPNVQVQAYPYLPGASIPSPLPIADGGTDTTLFAINGAVLSGPTTTSALSAASLGPGALLIGGSGAPAAATLTAGSGITIVNGNNSITISSSSSGLTWNDVTTPSATMAPANGYLADNAALVTLTLPATAPQFSVIEVSGYGAGGWTIAQNAGQSIQFGSGPRTTVGAGGSLSSTNQYDQVSLLAAVGGASTVWVVQNAVGNLTIV